MTVTKNNIGKVLKIMQAAMAHLPDPSVTLVAKRWGDPFLVLISCLLSLRTNDRTTLPASERLFAVADTPKKMSMLTAGQIERLIYPVSFYRVKARRILGICRDLLDKFDAKVPNDMQALLTLKGVGRKTANLVLTDGFGILAVCVDTHVHRISNRFGYVRTRTPADTEAALRRVLPPRYWIEYNRTLVLWGQNICRPISPFCSRCAVRGFCARKGVKISR